MPSESLADVGQSDWKRACRKLRLEVDEKRGNGSHFLVKHPSNGKKYTIQYKLHRGINMKILKTLMSWGFTEEAVMEALR